MIDLSLHIAFDAMCKLSGMEVGVGRVFLSLVGGKMGEIRRLFLLTLWNF